MKCPYCKLTYEKIVSIVTHASSSHGKTSEQIFLDLNGMKEVPVCECGCGGKTTYRGITLGFNKFILGHASRIKNNWGHNEEASAKSADTRKKMYENGEIKGWCAGLSVETSKKVREMVEKGRNTILSDSENRRKRSNNMRKNRLDGTVKSLYGKEHPKWSGGSSSLTALSDKKLYQIWKYPALLKAGFKCEKCSSTQNLHVHHSEIRMSEIIALCRPKESFERELLYEEKLKWVNDIVVWHKENNPPAEILCKACHSNVHPSLNFKR